MKKKSLIILSLIVLLTGTMLLGYFFKTSKRSVRVQSTSALKSIGAEFNIEDVGIIRINDMQFDYEVYEHTNRKEYWTYKDTEKKITIVAWIEKIEKLLNDLKGFSQGRIVEAKPANLAKYGLAESDREDTKPYTVSLEAKSGEKILDFTFSQSTDPTYARFEGDKAIYKVASTLHSVLSSESIYWLDTRIFTPNVSPTFKPAEVVSVIIRSYEGSHKGTKIVEINKDTGSKKKKSKDEAATTKWTLADSSATLDRFKVSRYLDSLVEAKAKDFSDVEVVDSMREAEVVVVLEDGSEIALTLYAFADNFYVKKRAHKNAFNQYTFLITKYLKDSLFPTSIEPFVVDPKSEPTNTNTEVKEEEKEEKKTK